MRTSTSQLSLKSPCSSASTSTAQSRLFWSTSTSIVDYRPVDFENSTSRPFDFDFQSRLSSSRLRPPESTSVQFDFDLQSRISSSRLRPSGFDFSIPSTSASEFDFSAFLSTSALGLNKLVNYLGLGLDIFIVLGLAFWLKCTSDSLGRTK